jgi:hypothetical protein
MLSSHIFKTALLSATLAGAVAAPGDPAPGSGGTEPSPPRENGTPARRDPLRSFSQEITPTLRLSIERGFNYLKQNQLASGSFAGSEGYTVAVNALVGLAFLAGGYTDKEGPYTETVRNCTQCLLSYQNEQGYFDDRESRMYGHGFATLYLAELHGMAGDQREKVRSALKRAVQVIELSQSSDGGWDYQPDSRFGGSGSRGESDTSITVCQAMALRAARNLGIQVQPAVVERARAYIRNAQNSDGGFCYRLSGAIRWGGGSQFPRSAAGVCILYSLAKTPEEYNSPQLNRGYDYLLENYRGFSQFPFYGQYYCTQAMFQAGGKKWAEYFPYLRDRLLKTQKKDGSWSGGGMEVTSQTTAMALISLQMPFRFLPITER